MTDIKKPVVVKNPYSKQLLKILSKKGIQFYQKYYQGKKDIFFKKSSI